MKRALRNPVLVLALGACLFLAACGSSEESGNGSGDGGGGGGGAIEVAFIGDLSGPVAPYSIASLEGLRVAIDEVNADGGIDGRQIRLKSYDDANDPIQTVNIAKREVSSAAAVVIASASSNVLAAGPELEKAGVPFFVTVSSNPAVTTSGWEWVNRVHLSDDDQITRILTYAVEDLSLEKVGVVADTTDFGQGGLKKAREVIKDLGGSLATEQTYNFGDNDFSSQVNGLRDAKVDGVLCWCLTDVAARVTEQLRSLGLNDVQILGGGGIVSNDFIELAGAAAEGTIASWGYLDPDNTTVKAMSDAYKEATDRTVDIFAAQSYDTGRILAQALAEAGTDAEALQAAIRAISYEGAIGSLTFDEAGQSVRDIRIGRVEDGTWVLHA